MMKFSYPGPARNVSYHNHSTFSDGASPIEDVCRMGKKLGLRELGMSDHWVIPPDDTSKDIDWRMAPSKLDSYLEILQSLKKELDDDTFTLRIGLEVDFFPENIDSVLAELKKYPIEYVIGSVHFSGTFGIDTDINQWKPFTEEQKAEICEIYWKKLEGAAARKEFLFLGHLDLPKKFALIDNTRYLPHAKRVLDIVAQNGGAIELNTAGWFKEIKEQYPSLEILKEANARRIPVVINADAHQAEHVRRNFDEAEQVLHQAGYPR